MGRADGGDLIPWTLGTETGGPRLRRRTRKSQVIQTRVQFTGKEVKVVFGIRVFVVSSIL